APGETPEHALATGEEWQAVVLIRDDPRFEGFDLSHGSFEVTGKFLGWHTPTHSFQRIAAVVESYRGRLESAAERVAPSPWCVESMNDSASMGDYTRWIDECLDAVVAASLPEALDVEGILQLWLVPNDFPWAGYSRLNGK